VFGLAKATSHIPVTGRRASARERLESSATSGG